MSKPDNLLCSLVQLTEYHKINCPQYNDIVDNLKFPGSPTSLAEIPFLPARLFKIVDLKSIADNKIHKILNSSGTSKQGKTKIFLDKKNSFSQIKALTSILEERIGKEKRPLLILDSKSVLTENGFSARKAGILGFTIFGSKIEFALNDDYSINLEAIIKFLEINKNKNILLYGFTFIIWKFILSLLLNNELKINLENATLIHGGGWKNIEQSIGRDKFNLYLKSQLNLSSIINYYGMIEQTGSIFLECEKGYFHSNSFATVLIRRVFDFSIAPQGEEGLIQVLSSLPTSYPGHSILTEDVGQFCGQDSCLCGRPGAYFTVKGRLQNSEIRGCSDTFEQI